MKTGKIIEKTAVINSFWKDIKNNRSLIRQRNKRDFMNCHTSDIRNAFVNYVNDLLNKKLISEELANSVTLKDVK